MNSATLTELDKLLTERVERSKRYMHVQPHLRTESLASQFQVTPEFIVARLRAISAERK